MRVLFAAVLSVLPCAAVAQDIHELTLMPLYNQGVVEETLAHDLWVTEGPAMRLVVGELGEKSLEATDTGEFRLYTGALLSVEGGSLIEGTVTVHNLDAEAELVPDFDKDFLVYAFHVKDEGWETRIDVRFVYPSAGSLMETAYDPDWSWEEFAFIEVGVYSTPIVDEAYVGQMPMSVVFDVVDVDVIAQ